MSLSLCFSDILDGLCNSREGVADIVQRQNHCLALGKLLPILEPAHRDVLGRLARPKTLSAFHCKAHSFFSIRSAQRRSLEASVSAWLILALPATQGAPA